MHERIAHDVEALEEGRITRSQFIRKGIAAGVSASVIGSVLAACGGKPASNGSSGSGNAAAPNATGKPPARPVGSLVYGNAEPPTAAYWDPAAGFGLVDEQVASLVHDSLLTRDAKGTIVPHLATKVERVSPTKVSVTLRQGVTFHDGTPLTPADVKASFDRLGAADTKLAQANTLSQLSCTVTGKDSLDIVTKEPFGPLEASLAYVKILPKADIDHPDNFKKRALGCGPYKFVSYKGSRVTLEANTDYWGEGPYIKTVAFDYIEDLDARTNALLTGDIDVMTRVGSEQLARVRGNKDYYTTKISPPSQYVSIYQHNGPLKDLQVRQAIAHAVDREAIAKGINKGLNPVPQSSLPTTSPLYSPLDTRFDYDPAAAKQLLAGKQIALKMATASLFSHQSEVDQAIAQYLEKVGIKVDITKLEAGAFRTSYSQYDMSLNTLTSFTADPDFILANYQPPTSEAIFHLNDPKIAPMVSAQRRAVGDGRQAKVDALASYLWEQQETLYLSDEVWYFIVNSKVQNYTRAPFVGEPLAAKAWVST